MLRIASRHRAAHEVMPGTVTTARNDVRQYDELDDEWWAPRGAFAMLHWIAAARAALIPPAPRPDAVLVDVACGGGVMAPHARARGYRHVGLDLSPTAVRVAAGQGVRSVRADVRSLPLADACADVVVAGEVLEHVADLAGVVSEACRVLRPGGLLVIDTIASTPWGRFSSITVAEHLPAGPPKNLHDGSLFVDRDALRRLCAEHGVELELRGLRPSALDYAAWLARRRDDVRMLPTRSTAGLFQARGVKAGPPPTRAGSP
ncbi:MAG TPA: methyltransferase domain-containing protein [Actinomycetales bacterium]|nr:methyltransferase domain-containing protein [Actinomycetales bacterium]